MNANNNLSMANDIKKLQMPAGKKTVSTELSGEFSLPDYQSEIRRLLRVEAKVMPPMRYIGNGNAKFSGNVNYDVLYAGGDGELCSLSLGDEYEFSMPLASEFASDMGNEIVIFADVLPDTVVSRVNAPRKLTIRTRLRADVSAYAYEDLDEKIRGDVDPDTVEKKLANAENMITLYAASEPLTLGEEILPDEGEGEVRIVSSRADVLVSEAFCDKDTCSYKGNVVLRVLCAREGRSGIEVYERKLPFEGSMEMEGADTEFASMAYGKCSEVKAVLSDDGKILCDVNIDVEGIAQKNNAFSYTEDIFSTEKECRAEYSDIEIPVAEKCFNSNFSHSAAEEIGNLNIDPSATPIDAVADAEVSGVVYERGKYIMSGECRYNVLFETNGEYSTQEISAPFRYEIDGASEEPEGHNACLTASPTRVRFDGERLAVDSEIFVACRIYGKNRIHPLDEAEFEGNLEARGGEVTVCYPASGETLWNIAKRYHVSVGHTAAKNNLPPDTDELGTVRYLIV